MQIVYLNKMAHYAVKLLFTAYKSKTDGASEGRQGRKTLNNNISAEWLKRVIDEHWHPVE